jgi:hypothetical protein
MPHCVMTWRFGLNVGSEPHNDKCCVLHECRLLSCGLSDWIIEMASIELSLGSGWTQVEPKETGYELLMSNQSSGQRLVALDTTFLRQRDLGFAGGVNCPLAVDETGDQVFVSVNGIVSYVTRESEHRGRRISDDLSPVWMLEYVSTGPQLLMHLFGEEPSQSFFARLDLANHSVRKELLPPEAFSPLDVHTSHAKILYSTRQGAAVFDVSGAIKTVAKVDLSVYVMGGAFDIDDQRIVLGGRELLGWNTETGAISRLCEHGCYPVIDKLGGVWFSHNEGALAKLRGEAGRFEVIVEVSGLDTSHRKIGSYAQPVSFSPDGRYGLVTLTGKMKLFGTDLEEAEAFCKRVGQPFLDTHQYRYNHYFCILDLELQEVWCSEGHAHNVAWVKSEQVSTTTTLRQSGQ